MKTNRSPSIVLHVCATLALLSAMVPNLAAADDDHDPITREKTPIITVQAGYASGVTTNSKLASSKSSGPDFAIHLNPQLRKPQIRRSGDHEIEMSGFAVEPTVKTELSWRSNQAGISRTSVELGRAGYRSLAINTEDRDRLEYTVLPLSAVYDRNKQTQVTRYGLQAGLFDLNYATHIGGPIDLCVQLKVASIVLGENSTQGKSGTNLISGGSGCLAARVGAHGSQIKAHGSAEATINGKRWSEQTNAIATQRFSAGLEYDHVLGSPVSVGYAFVSERSVAKDLQNPEIGDGRTLKNDFHHVSISADF